MEFALLIWNMLAAQGSMLLITVALFVIEHYGAAVPGPVQSRLNAVLFIVGPLIGRIAATLVGVVVTFSVEAAGGGLIALPRSGLGFALSLLVYLIAIDFAEYIFHRAQHAIPALWAMHSLHHSDPCVHVLTTERHFWAERAIKQITIYFAVALVFKVPVEVVGLFGLISYYNVLTHANLKLNFGRFSWLLNSPDYHRLHHAKDAQYHDCNYAALLPIFDVIFGSYRRPRKGEYPATGLDTGEYPKTLADALLWPARRLRQLPPVQA